MSTSMAGAPFNAYGAMQQGEMTSETLNNQADNLQAQAAEAEKKGQSDAAREQMIAGQKIGTSLASYGASGVSANSGSVLDVVQFSHQNAELDRLNILHGADIRSINYQNQAVMDRYGAASAIKGAYWQALGAITGGALSSYSDFKGAKPKGEEGESGDNYDGTGGSGEGAATEVSGAASEGAAGADTGASVAAIA